MLPYPRIAWRRIAGRSGKWARGVKTSSRDAFHRRGERLSQRVATEAMAEIAKTFLGKACRGEQSKQRVESVGFPADSGPFPVWRGREMQPGDIMFHSRGERLHQSTSGASIWNVIAMDPAQLERYGRSLSGRPFSSPPEGRALQLPTRLATRLPRLHAQICRLAQTKSKMLSHSEVARVIEQGLIEALITCLTTARAHTNGYAKRHHARIMVRFEEVLAEHLSRPLQMPELCELIVVSDRTLRSSCAEFLGMTPIQYVLLRRLEEVRRALRDADPDIVRVGEVAHRFGFTQLGRFAGRYRATFGETPSTTLQRIPEARLAAL